MKKPLKAAACAAATLIGCANAQAADIQTTANGCGDGCTTITVAGEIRENDWKTFAGIAKAENATMTIVALASSGGELYSALRMGLLIRAGFATVVPENMECASGCALMWLAGTPRMAGPPRLLLVSTHPTRAGRAATEKRLALRSRTRQLSAWSGDIWTSLASPRRRNRFSCQRLRTMCTG